MKMLGAKAFWAVFRICFFYLQEFLKKVSDERMKLRWINKVGKFEVKKVKNKAAVGKNVVQVTISPRYPWLVQ